jgi:hypothetical protein
MKTFEELAQDNVGTVYEDFVEKGIRCRILRGPSSLVAYLGIPPKHPLAGKHYNNMQHLDVHGGLTFNIMGGKKDNWPAGYYWYGWDYRHDGDASFFHYEIPELMEIHNRYADSLNEHGWTVEEVKLEVIEAAGQMRKLLDRYKNPFWRFQEWVKEKIVKKV